MSPGSDDRPRRHRWSPRRPRAWSLGTPLVGLMCGALFVVSAENSQGTDLRPGRYTDLATLVRTESQRHERLQDRVADLNADVARLTAAVDDRTVNRYRRDIAVLRDPAGLVDRTGPGVTVTLSDAPEEVVRTVTERGGSLNPLVVHQQDIQAVVNAMWKGGADAVTVQGKRIISTTGIKCIGNSVTLQGRPYSPPYVISAVGDPGQLLAAIDDDEYLRYYREQAAQPEIAVGWRLEVEESLTAPGYEGLLDLSYAEPIR